MSDTTRRDPSFPDEPTARGATPATGRPDQPPLTGDTHRDADDDAPRSEPRSDDPLAIAKKPDNRAALALATAALTLLNLLLLIAVLANVVGDDYEAVVVEGEACVLEVAGDDSVLYCRR